MFCISHVVVVSVLCLVTFSGFGLAGPINHHGHHRHHASSTGGKECAHARQHFQRFLMPQRNSVQEFSNGRPMTNLCSSTAANGGCCHGLEIAIERKTREQFRSAISKHVSTFRGQFEQQASLVKHRVFSILDDTVKQVKKAGQEREMQRAVATIDVIFEEIRKSFDHFGQYRGNKQPAQLDLQQAASGFIKAVVIDILEKDFGKKFPTDLLDCLHQIDFDDFNNLTKLSNKMHRSLHFAYETASIVFQTVGHFEALLNRSMGVQLTEKCVRQLAGDLHCSACDGTTTMKQISVCGSTCRRAVLEGSCLESGVMPWIGDSWKKMAESFNQFLLLGFLNERNPENSFTEFATLAAKAIHEAHDIKDDIKNKAEMSCGNPSRSYRSVNHGSPSSSSTPESLPEQNFGGISSQPRRRSEHSESQQLVQFGEEYKQSLFVSVESLTQILLSHKNLFANLTDKICLEFSDENCSHQPSEVISKHSVGSSTGHQQRGGNSRDDEYLDVIGRFQLALEKHHKKISNSTKYMLLESEESSQHFITDGSGSGHGIDDEDDDDDSEVWSLGPVGSGDYPDPSTDMSENPTSHPSTPNSNNNNDFTFNVNEKDTDPDVLEEETLDADSDDSAGGAATVRFSVLIICIVPMLALLFERRHV